MAGTIQCGHRGRKDFGKIPSIVEIPNLIEVQKRSYETFLHKDDTADRRAEVGLQAVFKSVFPIADYNDNALLEFDSYHFGDPKYTVEECHDRGMTFAIPLKVTLRLVVFDHDKEAKTRTIREQRGQEVYLGELPLMTDKGTFIINGTERVVVSQLQRSAGVFFDDDKGKTLASGKPLFSARVIPYRGSWVEFDFDANDILHVRVDRRRKMLATAFLRAFWFLERNIILSDEEILAHFYEPEEVLSFEDGNAWVKLSAEAHTGTRPLQEPRRGARGDLSSTPARRPADRGVGARLVPGHVHGSAALRSGPGRPLHDQREARHRGAGQRQDDPQRRHHLGHPAPDAGAAGDQGDRRHRPPRQPPRAVGGRVAREPVPGRPDADGAGGQGADVDLRHHQPDAARPDQRQASLGGGQGVL